MEIKPEKKRDRKLRFLWLLLLANVVLIFGIWQYHRLLVEVTDGAAIGMYQRLLGRGGEEGTLSGKSLRVALFRSEATAISFGENREGYYNLIRLWREFLEREGFGYEIVDAVPDGEAAKRFNLLLVPAARNIRSSDRRGVKAFLRAGKGVLMTWATGTRDEFGQWQRYSLLQEVAGIELAQTPPVQVGDDVSTVLLSGGYPLTANLYPGIMLRITAFDQPLAGMARESRTQIDGVWTDPDDSSYALHSLRDRAAVVHGTYFGGRYAWMGFTIGSAQLAPQQQAAFASLLRSSLLWTGNQVHAFKPVWSDGRRSLASFSLNITGPADKHAELLSLVRRYQVPLVSFVNQSVLAEHTDWVQQLAEIGEVAILLDEGGDYAGRTMQDQQQEFQRLRAAFAAATGREPVGVRLPVGETHNESTLDAAVRAGFLYVSTQSMDQLVPKPVRSYRPFPVVTRPRTLWLVPQMPYAAIPAIEQAGATALLAHFSQVASLGGFYCLAVQPAAVDARFIADLEELFQLQRRVDVPLYTVADVTRLWQAWDNIKVTVRYLSESRVSIRVSNTWTEDVEDIVLNVEMPYEQENLDLEAMTLGTRLPDRMTVSGVRWQLHLDRLRAGKNVAYYLHVDRSQSRAVDQPTMPVLDDPGDAGAVGRDVW